MMDVNQIEAIFKQLDRKIWILTASAGSRRGGLLATWVSQASLDPTTPTVLAGIAPNHFTAELIDEAGSFAAHLLRSDQLDVAWNFCLDSGRERDKLADVPCVATASGAPRLTDCLAWLECRVFACLPTSDRNYFWADVTSGEFRGPAGQAPPLSENQLVASANDAQRKKLIEGRQADLALHRPAYQQWRSNLPPGLAFPPGS